MLFALVMRVCFKFSSTILTKVLPKRWKNTSKKNLFFNVDVFTFGDAFRELLGGSWASLGTPWGPKWRPGAMESLTEDDFFFALVIFVSQIRIFTNLGRFGEGFGKVLGVFGEDFGGFCGRFLEVLRNTSLVFGNGSPAHHMRFKTITLQKWLNENRLHTWKHVSYPWKQF